MKRSSFLIVALVSRPGIHFGQVAEVPTELASKPVRNKLGWQLNEHSLSWKADGQRSYEGLAASSQARLAVEVGNLGESGRRDGLAPQEVLCGGKAFGEGLTIWWKVLAAEWHSIRPIRLAMMGTREELVAFLGPGNASGLPDAGRAHFLFATRRFCSSPALPDLLGG